MKRTRKPRYWTHKKRPGQKFLGNYEKESEVEFLDYGGKCYARKFRRIFKLKNAKTGREINMGSVARAKAKGWRLK